MYERLSHEEVAAVKSSAAGEPFVSIAEANLRNDRSVQPKRLNGSATYSRRAPRFIFMGIVVLCS